MAEPSALEAALSKYADRVSADRYFAENVAGEADDINLSDEDAVELLAHSMWRMGGTLDHKKCNADNDSNYVCICGPCNAYLLAIAELVLIAERTGGGNG